MTAPLKLNDEQLDSLKEVGNIGAGQAAARLSELIQRRCLISVPSVSYLDLAGIKKTFDMADSFAVALVVKIMGDIPAHMFVITKRSYVQLLVKIMTKVALHSSGKDMDFTSRFALKQLGETLTRAFNEAINQFLRIKARYAMPEIVIDSWSTALDTVLSQIPEPEAQQFVIHSSFYDSEKSFEGQFLYVLSPQAQEMVQNRIGLLLSS